MCNILKSLGVLAWLGFTTVGVAAGSIAAWF